MEKIEVDSDILHTSNTIEMKPVYSTNEELKCGVVTYSDKQYTASSVLMDMALFAQNVNIQLAIKIASRISSSNAKSICLSKIKI